MRNSAIAFCRRCLVERVAPDESSGVESRVKLRRGSFVNVVALAVFVHF